MKLKVISYLATLPRSKTPESVAKNLDKTNTLRYYIEGVNVVGDFGEVKEDTAWEPSDVAVILGWVHEHSKDSPHLKLRREIIDNQKRNGGRTVIADSNLFLYRDVSNPGYWLRYSFDHVFPGLGEYCDNRPDPVRWQIIQDQLGVTLKPWRTQGNHILLCLQRDGGWSMGGFDVIDWAMNTIAEIRRYTGRPIVIRAHPGDKRAPKYCARLQKLLLGRRVAKVSITNNRALVQDLENCWAVVNHNSSPTVAAAIEGIPVFVTDPQRSQAQDVANHHFNRIENPDLFDRDSWIQRLSQFHWSHADLRSGQCWNHMRQWVRA